MQTEDASDGSWWSPRRAFAINTIVLDGDAQFL
jgi:hypothetical protein